MNSLVSEQTIAIRRPFHDVTVVPSFHRVLVTTNALSPLLDHSVAFQRRFTVIPCGTVDGQEFYEAMHDPIKMDQFRQYLMERQVDANGL